MSQFSLLKQKQFFPLFITQFLGALHDNLFKNAIIVLLIFGHAVDGVPQQLMVNIAAGLFIFPYIIFSGLGAELGTKYDKSRLIQALKIAEVMMAVCGIASIIFSSIEIAYLTLFMLGTHSALFAPSKYSILPEHLTGEQLMAGNALLSGGTFIAILIGTIAGSSLINVNHGQYIVSAIIMICAAIGWITSTQIPACKYNANKILNYNVIKSSIKTLQVLLRISHRQRLQILGSAWFLFLSSTLILQLPNYVKEVLHANEQVLTLLLAIFSIGIAMGGLLNNKILQGRIESTFVPLAAVGMGIICIDLYFASFAEFAISQTLDMFLCNLMNWRIILDIFAISIFGGLFIVPLSSMIQNDAAAEMRTDIMGATSIIDAIFICAAAIIAAVLMQFGVGVAQLVLVLGLINLLVSIYIISILPRSLLKSVMQIVFKVMYRVEIRGAENIQKAGPSAVIISNHVSLLDGPLLAAFLPGGAVFAVDTSVFAWPCLQPFLKVVGALPLDPSNPYAIKTLIKKVKENNHVVIFPEGRLTKTGALMKIYHGPGMIAQKSGAPIIPVRIDGVQYSKFSKLKDKLLLRHFPKIIITVMEPVYIPAAEYETTKDMRLEASKIVHNIMEDMLFRSGNCQQTLFDALQKSSSINGKKTIILEDVVRKPISNKRLVSSSTLLGKKIALHTDVAENVGLLLPNSTATVVTFFALQAYGRVPAMLNYSLGSNALLSACNVAGIKNIVTSKKFIELAKLESVIEKLLSVTNIIYLEDIKQSIKWHDLILNILIGNHGTIKHKIKPDDIALVLFTSGSEGTPKGVALSHTNILSNIKQLEARVDFNQQDVVFNCLPLFHSFGITAGLLLPVFNGIKTFLYPSPLHYKNIPEAIYFADATIMFGTDTFLSAYAKEANPYDFYKMRYIFAGAEKVKSETKNMYMEKFGIRIFEGYGATETSPVLCVNSPQFNRNNSVGKFLTGIEHRIETVPGINTGGRLFVKGPNVMLGYFKADAPGTCQKLADGWYDTGDIVVMDNDGFVSIDGRAKRFAKIAGEMVSLSFVEEFITKLWPENSSIVVSIPDERKGEKLCLITTNQQATRDEIIKFATANDVSNLNVPVEILKIDEIPVLPTGKVDYLTAQKLVAI